MRGTYKRVTAFLLTLIMLLPAGVLRVSAAESMLYESKKTQVVTSGVTCDEVVRLYDRGWVSFNALRIDLRNPNVKFDVLQNVSEHGLRETVGDMVLNAGSVAAVNADFFNMNGALSTSMGIVARDGQVAEARNYYNSDAGTYAGLYIDRGNNAFIDYLKVSNIGFITNGESKLVIDGKNKITDMKLPVYIDRTAMADTSALDARFKDLYKIVVANGRIADISAAGAVKAVPEDGFIIVMNGPTAVENLNKFAVGDEASFVEYYSFLGNSSRSVSDIKFGISGGGRILENGETRESGLIVEAQKRHPRTVLGMNRDKTELVLIAIDGRTANSIGATHWEAAEILREYGAWDAFHFDGGGSTTLFARNEGETAASIQNIPSEGTQRKVANAVGISSIGVSGGLAGLYVFADGKKEGAYTMATQPVTLTVSGYDTNMNPVSVAGVSFTQEGARGVFSGNTFTPQEEGETVITANYGGVTSSVSVRVLSKPTALRITPRSFKLEPGGTVHLKAELVNKDGYGVDITNRSAAWGVTSGLGYFEGQGVFKAAENGKGTITVSYGGLIGFSQAAVGTYIDTALDFESIDNVSFSGANGSVAYTNAIKHDGQHSLQVNYAFKAGDANPQTAAIDFRNARAEIVNKSNSFGFFMTGDAAGSSVSASFTDASDKEHLIGFTEKMENGDWRYYHNKFPDSMSFPAKLSYITITSAASLSAPVNAKIYLDTLQVSHDYEPDLGALIQDAELDYMRRDLSPYAYGAYEDAGTEITVFGPTAHATTDYELAMLERVVMIMQQNSNLAIFAGYTANILPGMASASLKWLDTYSVRDLQYARVITLATGQGGMRQTSPQQWKNLINDLENSPHKNVVVVMNKDIWDNANGFADSKERDLLHKVLSEFNKKKGANVMVVAGVSPETKAYVYDGIRYITLNGLVTAGASAPEYNVLRIRVSGDNMWYDIEGIEN